MKINICLCLSYVMISFLFFTSNQANIKKVHSKIKANHASSDNMLDLTTPIHSESDHLNENESENSNGDDKTADDKLKKLPSHLENQDPNNLWGKLFSVSRTTNCEQTRIYDNIVNEILHKDNTLNSASSKFYWIKEWGYGPAAYFFDYIDSVLREDVVKEFRNIYRNVTSYSNKDLPNYSDELDMNRQMSKASALTKAKYAKKLKEFNSKINTGYYSTSANSVQLHQAMPVFKWFIANKDDNYAKEFVLDYDIDGDGRLNARELILASIRNNRIIFDNPSCILCYKDVIAKIDAIFKFMNCAHTGFVDAEQMWDGFPLLVRPTSKYNIFGIKNSLSIRTDAINDIVLKNWKAKEGFINKDEFRQGILLGFWDRQTTESGIIDDDSRNLKKLRWSEDGTKDTIAYNYMKETIILEMKAKAEERKRNMVNYKNQNQVNSKKTTTVTN